MECVFEVLFLKVRQISRVTVWICGQIPAREIIPAKKENNAVKEMLTVRWSLLIRPTIPPNEDPSVSFRLLSVRLVLGPSGTSHLI